jgi:S1-C subfamily serine protease
VIAKRFWWLVFVALVSCASDPGVEESPASVVLVVADLDGGGTSYGAGVVLDGSGNVVTNWHVLRNAHALRAMLYQRDRTSYTPMDGGLARFLSENAAALFDADLVRADPDLDIALIHVRADTSHVPKPTLANDPPRVGERIFALGPTNRCGRSPRASSRRCAPA